MKIKIDENNYVILDLQCGGRIIELVLAGHVTIKAQKPYCDLSTGMFLMFPWVSKVPDHPYQHQLKNQYHGFVMNTPRSITITQLEQTDKIQFTLQQKYPLKDKHNFIETYTLSKGKLSINFEVLPNKDDNMPWCFGYHPYLQIDDKSLDTIVIKSDITTLLQFDQDTLPIYPFEQKQIVISEKGTYNNLFKGGSYLQIISSQGTHLKITSDLPYWQIYNPADRTKIAVQPVSFCGDLYNIYKKDPTVVLADKGQIALTVWQE